MLPLSNISSIPVAQVQTRKGLGSVLGGVLGLARGVPLFLVLLTWLVACLRSKYQKIKKARGGYKYFNMLCSIQTKLARKLLTNSRILFRTKRIRPSKTLLIQYLEVGKRRLGHFTTRLVLIDI